MLRLLFEAHTVQNFNLKESSSEAVVGVGVGASNGTSTVPSKVCTGFGDGGGSVIVGTVTVGVAGAAG
jgi:hypothetical protein